MNELVPARRRKGTAGDLNYTTTSVKHGVTALAWACVAASGTGSLVFIDDVAADGSSRRNSQDYYAILCSDSAHCCKTDRRTSERRCG